MEPPKNLTEEQIQQHNVNFEQAVASLEGVIEIQDATKGIFGWFARRRIKKALESLDICLKLVPNSWQSMWFAGKAHQALDEHETALGFFEQALSIENENPDVPREASIEAMTLGHAFKAENYANEACKRNEKDHGLVANLALALLLSKKVEDALNTAGRAVRMNPQDPLCGGVLRYIARIQSGEIPCPDKLNPASGL
ncbi:hypothetical protein ACFL6Y_06285 [Elusimicrobiota bacterium]